MHCLEIFRLSEMFRNLNPDYCFADWFAAVMQTEGFEHLKVSCPSILTELLEYVAKVGERSIKTSIRVFEPLDGSDVNGRRVKPRII